MCCFLVYLHNVSCYRIELLKSELSSKREVEHEEAIHLEKAMEQVEDNLKRSTVSKTGFLCLIKIYNRNFSYREEQ